MNHMLHFLLHKIIPILQSYEIYDYIALQFWVTSASNFICIINNHTYQAFNLKSFWLYVSTFKVKKIL